MRPGGSGLPGMSRGGEPEGDALLAPPSPRRRQHQPSAPQTHPGRSLPAPARFGISVLPEALGDPEGQEPRPGERQGKSVVAEQSRDRGGRRGRIGGREVRPRKIGGGKWQDFGQLQPGCFLTATAFSHLPEKWEQCRAAVSAPLPRMSLGPAGKADLTLSYPGLREGCERAFAPSCLLVCKKSLAGV